MSAFKKTAKAAAVRCARAALVFCLVGVPVGVSHADPIHASDSAECVSETDEVVKGSDGIVFESPHDKSDQPADAEETTGSDDVQADYDESLVQDVPASSDVDRYTIRFEKGLDEAIGQMDDVQVSLDVSAPVEMRLPECAFKVQGRTFAGWMVVDPAANDAVPARCMAEGFLVPDGQRLVDLVYEEGSGVEGSHGVGALRDLKSYSREGTVTLVASWVSSVEEPNKAEAVEDMSNDEVTGEEAVPAVSRVADGADRSQQGDRSSTTVLVDDGGAIGAFVVTSTESSDENLLIAPGSTAYYQTARLLAASSFSHAVVTLTGYDRRGTSYSGSASTSHGSVNAPGLSTGNNYLWGLTATISGGGVTGGISYESWVGATQWYSGSNGSQVGGGNAGSAAWKMWLTGNYALAYSIAYEVHATNHAGAVGDTVRDGAEAQDMDHSRWDGVGFVLIPRSYTHTVQVRYQNADGSWGGWSNARQTSVAYGSTVDAWSRAQDATYQAALMSAYTAGYANKTTQVSIYRRTATNTIQARYQNADGSWGSYGNVSSGTDRVGQVRSWSRAQDATYAAASASITGTASAQTKKVDVNRNSYTTSFNTQGGTAVVSYSRLAESKFANPSSEPTRQGYVFAGWWTKAEGGDRVTTSTITPSANVTYYAHWDAVVQMPVAGLRDDSRNDTNLIVATCVVCALVAFWRARRFGS